MHRPNYNFGHILNAVRANIEPEIYDDVVAWDDDSYGVATGVFLEKLDCGYSVLAYFDKPQVFTWAHVVKIEAP